MQMIPTVAAWRGLLAAALLWILPSHGTFANTVHLEIGGDSGCSVGIDYCPGSDIYNLSEYQAFAAATGFELNYGVWDQGRQFFGRVWGPWTMRLDVNLSGPEVTLISRQLHMGQLTFLANAEINDNGGCDRKPVINIWAGDLANGASGILCQDLFDQVGSPSWQDIAALPANELIHFTGRGDPGWISGNGFSLFHFYPSYMRRVSEPGTLTLLCLGLLGLGASRRKSH